MNALVAIDSDTGHRTIVSDDAIGSGPNLLSPRAIALDTPNNRMFVVDTGWDALTVIDLSNGNRAIVSK